jgi:hypothetical protein
MRKLKIALFGELSLEEAMDLSRDRQILDLTILVQGINVLRFNGIICFCGKYAGLEMGGDTRLFY